MNHPLIHLQFFFFFLLLTYKNVESVILDHLPTVSSKAQSTNMRTKRSVALNLHPNQQKTIKRIHFYNFVPINLGPIKMVVDWNVIGQKKKAFGDFFGNWFYHVQFSSIEGSSLPEESSTSMWSGYLGSRFAQASPKEITPFGYRNFPSILGVGVVRFCSQGGALQLNHVSVVFLCVVTIPFVWRECWYI